MREEFTVVIRRTAKEPIGLNITGGRELEAGAIFVHSTRDNGPCAGLLLDEDVIVSINGNLLGESSKRSDAVEIVEGSDGDLTFVVLREPHSGMLIKQGFRKKNWKKRLFVINKRELSYYPPQQATRDVHEVANARNDKSESLNPMNRWFPTNQQQGAPLGTVCLDRVRSIDDFSLPSKKELFGFQLVSAERTYYMFAETEKEKKRWIDVLTPLIGGSDIDDMMASEDKTSSDGKVVGEPQYSDDDDDTDGDDDLPREANETTDAKVVGSSDSRKDGEAEGEDGTRDDQDDSSAGDLSRVGSKDSFGEETLVDNATAMSTTVAYTGFMLKSSPDFKSWKRRFFVLKDMELHYYKSQEIKGKPQGSVTLGSGCSIEAYEGPNAKGRKHAFRLTVVGGRQYVCSCINDIERDKWITAIKRELEK